MMTARHIAILAIVYTLVVALMVEFTNVSGGVVLAIAAAWFCLGRMVGRGDPVPTRPTRWGRQP
ncbi:MAG: hypothetical protein M9905_17635 [Rhizobiaceae bacterium]|nr:hypothetical protein [Rhizobiaceae bacterium]